MNDNYKTEVREETFNLFKIEWERIGSKQDKIFGRLLENDYKETCRKIKKNKKRNFRIKLFGLILPFFVIIVFMIF